MIRKPGRALFRTYIYPKTNTKGRRFQARVVDVRTGQDIKNTSDTFEKAVSWAESRMLAKKSA